MDSQHLVEIAKRYKRTETSALSSGQLFELANAAQLGQPSTAIEAPRGAEHMLTLDILNTLIAFFALTIEVARYLKERRDTADQRGRFRELLDKYPQAKVTIDQLHQIGTEIDDKDRQ